MSYQFTYVSEVGKEHDLECEVYTTPFVSGRNYMSNGDPGYPDEGGDFDVYSIKKNGVELINKLSSKQAGRIQDQLLDFLDGYDGDI